MSRHLQTEFNRKMVYQDRSASAAIYMTGPRRLVSTDPVMRAATLAACAMGNYDIEDSCTLDTQKKNDSLNLPHVRWRYHFRLRHVWQQCFPTTCRVPRGREVTTVGVLPWYRKYTNDQGYTSPVHQQSANIYDLSWYTISRSLGFSYPWTAGCSPCFESFEWQRCLGKCRYLAWLLGLWTSGSGSNETFGGTALVTGGVDVDMEPSELRNP